MFEDFRLRVFVTVVDSTSFTEAARTLGISQPAVSQHISQLEAIVGEPLFMRTRSSLALSESGRCFYGYATKILSLYEQMDRVLVHKTEAPAEPVLLSIDDSRKVEVSVVGGEIHIKMP